MNQARFAHKALPLVNGSVLVMGGSALPDADGKWQESSLLASCEIWDPVSETWTLVKNMTYARANFQVPSPPPPPTHTYPQLMPSPSTWSLVKNLTYTRNNYQGTSPPLPTTLPFLSVG